MILLIGSIPLGCTRKTEIVPNLNKPHQVIGEHVIKVLVPTEKGFYHAWIKLDESFWVIKE